MTRFSYLLCPNNISWNTYVYCIHSSVDGHWGCFHVSVIVNMLQWTRGCRCYLFEVVISLPLDIYPELELLGHIIVQFLHFSETVSLHTVFHRGCTPTAHKGSLFSTFLPNLCLILLITGVLTGESCYAIVVLICISLMIRDAEHPFPWWNLLLFSGIQIDIHLKSQSTFLAYQALTFI